MNIIFIIFELICFLESTNSVFTLFKLKNNPNPIHYLENNEPKAIKYSTSNPKPLFFLYILKDQSSSVHISFFIQDHSFYDDDKILIAYKIHNNHTKYFPKASKEINNTKSFEINKKQLESLTCFQSSYGCRLYITVFLKKEPNYHGKKHPYFIIQISRSLISLNIQKQYKGSIDRNQLKYFQLDIENDKEENTIIFFLKTHSKNEIYLLINRGKDNNWPDPIYNDYSWKTNKNSEKNYFSMTQKIDQFNCKNNSYIIAVYGKAKTKFILKAATYANSQIVDLFLNKQFNFNLKAKEIIYCKYKKNNKEVFRVVLSKNYGDYLFAILPIQYNDSIVEKIANFNDQNYVWKSVNSRNIDTFFINNDSEFYCVICTYLIIVKASQDSSINILISKNPIYLDQNKNLKDSLQAGENNSYISIFYEDSIKIKIIVSILVYHGTIIATLNNASSLLNHKTNDNSNFIKMVYEDICTFPNEISIIIQGITSSSYNIEIHAERKEKFISLGYSELEEASPFTRQNFLFDSDITDEENLFYSVKIKTKAYVYDPVERFLERVLDNTKLSFMIKDKNNKITYPIVSFSRDYYEIFARVKAIKGIYCICVDNSQNSNWFSYKIELNILDIETIYNNMKIEKPLTVGQSKYFYFQIIKIGRIIIEFSQCSGKNQFSANSNQINTIDENKSFSSLEIVKNSKYSSRIMIDIYDINHLKELYIVVKSLESEKKDLILYDNHNLNTSSYILTIWLTSSKTPYELFYPGDSGNIDVFLNDGKDSVITIKRLTYDNSLLYSNLKKNIKSYSYIMKIDDNEEEVEKNLLCNKNHNPWLYKRNLISIVEHTYSHDNNEGEPNINFTVNLKNFYWFNSKTVYYVKILAQVFVEEDKETQIYSFFYKTKSFYQVETYEKESIAWLEFICFLVILPILAFFIMIVVYVYWGKSKRKIDYNIEMQDLNSRKGEKIKHLKFMKKTKKEYEGSLLPKIMEES